MKFYNFIIQKSEKRDNILLSCALNYIFFNWLSYNFQFLYWEELLLFYHILLLPILAYVMILNIAEIVKRGIGRSADRILRSITISVVLLCAILNYSLYPTLSSAIFSLWIGLAIISLRISLTLKIPDGESKLKTVLKRISIVLGMRYGSISRNRLRRLMSLCLAYTFGTWFSICAEIQPNADVTPTDDSLVKTYFDSLKQLNDPQFDRLCAYDKLNVMQCIANIESTINQQSVAPTVVACFLSRDNNWHYAHETKTILICIDSLDADARKCLNSVLNGMYHNSLCERYLYNVIWQRDPALLWLKAEYESNFAQSRKCGDMSYLNTLEANASKYATRSINEYFDRINSLQTEPS